MKTEVERSEWTYRGISVSMPSNIGPSEWLTLRAYIELFRPQNAIWKEKPAGAPCPDCGKIEDHTHP